MEKYNDITLEGLENYLLELDKTKTEHLQRSFIARTGEQGKYQFESAIEGRLIADLMIDLAPAFETGDYKFMSREEATDIYPVLDEIKIFIDGLQ